MRTKDRLIAPSRGTAGAAKAYGISGGAHRPDGCRAYVQTVYDLCAQPDMIDASIVVAQSLQETSDPGPWQSYWWTTRLNPAGLGITGDPVENAQSPTFQTGEEAARAQASHLLLYATGTIDRGGLTPADDPRYAAYVQAYGNVPMAETIAELAGTWAMDPLYAQGIVRRGNDCFAGLPDQDQGETPVSQETEIPGLPGGLLVTSYPIRFNPIPSSQTRQRPGLSAHTPRRSVQHGTGNPNNASAWAESEWFVNGADGGTASVHYCTDDHEAIILVPLDEVTWQAADGAGPGNMNGFSCEMMEASAIWQDFGRRDRLIALTADLMGRTAARLGAASPERHWDFNAGTADRHHCPNMLMSTGLWETSYVPKWQAARADELKRMRGDKPEAPDVDYPPKRVPAPDVMKAQGFALAFTKPSRFKCLQGGYFKTYPNRDAPNGTSTPYKAGRVYTLGFSTVVDGEPWLVSAAGSWTPAKNFEGVT